MGGRPALRRYALSRWNNQDELDKLVTEWTLQRHTNYEVMHTLQAAGVAAGPSLNAEGLVNDPHLIDRGRFVPMGIVEGNPYTHVAQPWHMSAAPEPNYSRAPRPGGAQHGGPERHAGHVRGGDCPA